MTTGLDKLHLLAYPITPELHGVVHLYRFPDRAAEAWHGLLDQYQQLTGSRGNLPYAGLLAGPVLNPLLAGGPTVWREVRDRLTAWLSKP